MLDRNLLKLSEEVEDALREGRAVVALESTVIAHGLPRPQNLETARRLEQVVRESGAVPATVAVLGGRLCVGLDDAQLERLAEGAGVLKVSRRALALVAARRADGATTVAGTLWVASRAGLKVFATGGIGGVHRGSLPDVSADLPELARTPLTVVCSGAKSVLDLPATREWLETPGICVVGYGTGEGPAFYTRRRGPAAGGRADSGPAGAARARGRAVGPGEFRRGARGGVGGGGGRVETASPGEDCCPWAPAGRAGKTNRRGDAGHWPLLLHLMRTSAPAPSFSFVTELAGT